MANKKRPKSTRHIPGVSAHKVGKKLNKKVSLSTKKRTGQPTSVDRLNVKRDAKLAVEKARKARKKSGKKTNMFDATLGDMSVARKAVKAGMKKRTKTPPLTKKKTKKVVKKKK